MNQVKNRPTAGRRNFLKVLGLSASGAGLVACTTKPTLVNPATADPNSTKTPTAVPPTITPEHTMEMPAASPAAQDGGADDMDAMHEKGVKFFLDNAGKDDTFWPKEHLPGYPVGYGRRDEDRCDGV